MKKEAILQNSFSFIGMSVAISVTALFVWPKKFLSSIHRSGRLLVVRSFVSLAYHDCTKTSMPIHQRPIAASPRRQ